MILLIILHVIIKMWECYQKSNRTQINTQKWKVVKFGDKEICLYRDHVVNSETPTVRFYVFLCRCNDLNKSFVVNACEALGPPKLVLTTHSVLATRLNLWQGRMLWRSVCPYTVFQPAAQWHNDFWRACLVYTCKFDRWAFSHDSASVNGKRKSNAF